MNHTIVIAGGTGHLGEKIINALLGNNATVRAIVRSSSDAEKVAKLREKGVEVYQVTDWNVAELTEACNGAACVVSALQGLQDVIVEAQTTLLDAAVAAGVPRFIPSDYSTDFTLLPAGGNRNFDFRRAFHTKLNKASIAATSIFNGAFAYILHYNIPILDLKKKSVGYWGDNADWKLDFSTMDDTAAFTAATALDNDTPRFLHIASFQVSPRELAALASEASGTTFALTNLGSLEDFAAYNQQQRAANPEGEKEMYPRWQNGQYMHDMFSVQHPTLDNNRYPDLSWTSAAEFIKGIFLKVGA